MVNTDLAALRQDIARIHETLMLLSRGLGAKLSREQVCERLGVHRNTLARHIKDRRFPAPSADGHWQLAAVMAWEEAQVKK